MSQPGMPVPPLPFFARGPGAPPPVPPADLWVREIFRTQIVRMISGSSVTALAVFGIVLSWLPVVGFTISLGVVIFHRQQLRLRDHYAPYFVPDGFPEDGALDAGRVLGLIGLVLSVLANVAWLTFLLSILLTMIW